MPSSAAATSGCFGACESTLDTDVCAGPVDRRGGTGRSPFGGVLVRSRCRVGGDLSIRPAPLSSASRPRSGLDAASPASNALNPGGVHSSAAARSLGGQVLTPARHRQQTPVPWTTPGAFFWTSPARAAQSRPSVRSTRSPGSSPCSTGPRTIPRRAGKAPRNRYRAARRWLRVRGARWARTRAVPSRCAPHRRRTTIVSDPADKSRSA